MLGELPARTSMRAYYKLENLNDSSGNSRTLTNAGTVPFNAGKFNKCADFGSSGTNKSLVLNANPMSGLLVADWTVSCWVKWNNSSTSNTNAAIWHLATRTTSGTGAGRTTFSYNVNAGNFELTARTMLTTTDAIATYNIPVNTTNWYNIIIRKVATTTIEIWVNGVMVATNTGVGSDNINVALNNCLSIGNRQLTATIQAWALIDEVIIEERLWSASEIRKYYSQGRGILPPN